MSERTTRNSKDRNSRHGAFSWQNGPDWPNVIPDRTLFGHIREQGKAASEAGPLRLTIRRPSALFNARQSVRLNRFFTDTVFA
ncbi:hypothetical protein HKD28_13320 [Gluconobacter sp. LMG 1744]|uniref:hypothetical protein n=1 Tax=Gluconobacter TaxID=441 RepID=UPI00188578AC|nr:hypothetical protein [Gluconobacter cadivus]MBF0892381.1 hypothetical protein [Gluconobacter cadivus]